MSGGKGEDDECMGMLQTLGRKELLEVLSQGFCHHCQPLLNNRVQNIFNRKFSELSVSNGNNTESSEEVWSADSSNVEKSLASSNKSTSWGSTRTPVSVYSEGQNGHFVNSSPSSVNSKQPLKSSGSDVSQNGGLGVVTSVVDNGSSEELVRFGQVGRKKDFSHIERIDGKVTNVVKGLELHTRVFNAEEQKKIVDCVYDLQRMGQKGQLRERTYSEPRKWMRGKGRVTMQFGCCYNYAVDKNGNPPGIIRDEEVDPLPPLFKQMIKRMVRWHVLPPTCVPNSCIVNIYDEGDCIPPHIDHHDFLRPFCTVSFLAECNILFGANLKIISPGEFVGPVSIPLPVGSVLILNGNGADVAKHCVPGVPSKRISITFRKMDDSKLPYRFSPDPELLGIKPLVRGPLNKSPVPQSQHENKNLSPRIVAKITHAPFVVERDDFPPLGKDDFPPLASLNSGNRQRANRNGLKP